jgi:hypothetical protein
MTRVWLEELARVLRAHPRAGSAELCARLGGISRATLARAIKKCGADVISAGAARRTRHALRRPLRGNAAPIPLHRVDGNGCVEEIGELSLIHPEGCALAFRSPFPWPLDRDMADGWFPGLPYPLFDMRPQGFLGRSFARAHAAHLDVSEDPERWSDEDIVHVLAHVGHDLPGDLILGDTACRRFLEQRREGGSALLSASEIESAYPRLAERALAHGEPGSSAGGEFPKFTAGREIEGTPIHVIVKFSGNDGSPAVRRWADLLSCEHHASAVIREVLGVPSAESALHRFAGRSFLEVRRFDRNGLFGRSPACTLASLNPALIGHAAASWPATASALQEAGWLATADVERIARLWWFGHLIANSDMHEGNLAFQPGLSLAPVYDMLPMAYAPLRGGELPAVAFAPRLPLPREAATWRRAAEAAVVFWQSCAGDARISTAFRRTCEDNAAVLSRQLTTP